MKDKKNILLFENIHADHFDHCLKEWQRQSLQYSFCKNCMSQKNVTFNFKISTLLPQIVFPFWVMDSNSMQDFLWKSQ